MNDRSSVTPPGSATLTQKVPAARLVVSWAFNAAVALTVVVGVQTAPVKVPTASAIGTLETLPAPVVSVNSVTSTAPAVETTNVFGTDPIADNVPAKKSDVGVGVVLEGVVGVLPPHAAADTAITIARNTQRFIKTSLPRAA